MSRLIRVCFGMAAYFSLSACYDDLAGWQKLPHASDSAYAIKFKSYDEGYADDAFAIRAVSIRPPGHENTLLRASQCKNVRIVQTIDTVYIFYDDIILAGFSSYKFNGSLPRPFLCDMRQAICKKELRNHLSRGAFVFQACSQA
jgi:hypothetical protein